MFVRSLVGGVLGTLAMDLIYAGSAAFLGSHHVPDDVDEETEAIVLCVRRLPSLVPRVVREHPAVTGRAIHYAFGCVFAGVYVALAKRSSSMRAVPFGIAVWLLSDRVLVPAGRPRDAIRYPQAERGIALVSHLAFAAAVASAAGSA